MKRKIISLLLVLVMLLSALALVACNDEPDPVDPNGGQGKEDGGDETEESAWWRDITYEKTEIRFQLTKCENAGLYPAAERLIEGSEAASRDKDLDDMIAERNDNAYFNTNVSVIYAYYNNDPEKYGWSKCIDVIYNEVQNKASTSPDIYCNFMTDMLSSSLKGSFANIYSKSRGIDGKNYFQVDSTIGNEGYAHSGYMSDLMGSLTLSLDKVYVIASDYFADLIRAFFVIPVDQRMYNAIAPTMIEDLNGDGSRNMADFFEEVKNGGWTYERLAQYCAKVGVDSGSTPGIWAIDDVLGFASDVSGGMMGSGLMYTSSVEVISKKWNDDKGDYDYEYAQENQALYDFADALKTLFSTDGVAAVANADTEEKYTVQAICNKFTRHEILFGGVIMVGSLENTEYQSMKGEGGGFGVVPVPVYKAGDRYLTQIHTAGGAGAISHVTTKFTQCTAFIQYQSTHSTEILNEYYDYNLTLDVSDGMEGNVEMLQYIRSNVRTSFDKLFEDAIGFFFLSVDEASKENRLHQVIYSQGYKVADMRAEYATLRNSKQDRLQSLVLEYGKLPD